MRRVAGFTYMTILFVVAIMGVGLALTGEVWHTAAMREKEAELLYVGNQYRKAIERYYLSGPRQYPRALSDLLKDPRRPGTERYLRQLYADPITGKEWGIVKAPDGGIMGVYSLSENAPLKVAGLALRQAGFAAASSYRDWQFVHIPGGAAASAAKATVQGEPDPVAPARERPQAQIPREPWVCTAERANDLRACEQTDGAAAETCRRRAADRYRTCIAGGVAAAAPAPGE